jgi:hypothetical protein
MTKSLRRLRKKAPTATRNRRKVDPVALAMLVGGPLHAVVAAAVSPMSTQAAIATRLAMPPRVVSVVVDSLLEINLLTAVRLDASVSAYTLAPPPYARVVAAVGTAFAAKVGTMD